MNIFVLSFKNITKTLNRYKMMNVFIDVHRFIKQIIILKYNLYTMYLSAQVIISVNMLLKTC